MNIIDKIKKKRENLGELINIKKISHTLKFFQNEIIELEKSNFTRTEQKEIFEKLLEIKIPYQTYNSFFVRNIKSNIRSKTDSKNKVDDINEVSTGATTPVDKKNNKTKENIISEEYKEIADSYGNCFKNNDNE